MIAAMARTRAMAIRLMYAIAAAWLVVVGWLWVRAYHEALETFAAEARRSVDGAKRDIDHVERAGSESASFLVHGPVAEALALEQGGDSALRRRFLVYASAHAEVFQLRLLSADGKERVRIERRADGSVVATDELQDKGDRYYFERARALGAGEVYVSPIDFNVEHGRVQDPARLTLRFAAPVHVDGHLAGVLVLNLEGAALLERVKRSLGHSVGTLMMIHEDGVLVSAPSASAPWKHLGALDDANAPAAMKAWLRTPTAGASWHDEGQMAARAIAGTTQIVLVTSERDVIAAKAGSFAPLLGGSAASGMLWVIALLGLRRHRRLSVQLERERALREKLASREARLEQTQQRLVASARLAALSESAATLAHELRNPLGAIVTSAGMLGNDEALDHDSRELMRIVLRECERLERAVTDFLELARRPAPRPERVNLEVATREVVSLARQDPSTAEAIDIELEQARDDAPNVIADPDEIRQVVWNVLRNATAATRRAGGQRVLVRVCSATLDDAPAAMIEVRDEGPGPPDDEDPPRGGLGFIVVAGIAARSGGRFELVAREDAPGALARVILPAAVEGSWPAF